MKKRYMGVALAAPIAALTIVSTANANVGPVCSPGSTVGISATNWKVPQLQPWTVSIDGVQKGSGTWHFTTQPAQLETGVPIPAGPHTVTVTLGKVKSAPISVQCSLVPTPEPPPVPVPVPPVPPTPEPPVPPKPPNPPKPKPKLPKASITKDMPGRANPYRTVGYRFSIKVTNIGQVASRFKVIDPAPAKYMYFLGGKSTLVKWTRVLDPGESQTFRPKFFMKPAALYKWVNNCAFVYGPKGKLLQADCDLLYDD